MIVRKRERDFTILHRIHWNYVLYRQKIWRVLKGKGLITYFICMLPFCKCIQDILTVVVGGTRRPSNFLRSIAGFFMSWGQTWPLPSLRGTNVEIALGKLSWVNGCSLQEIL